MDNRSGGATEERNTYPTRDPPWNDREGTEVRLAACSSEGWRILDALHFARSVAARARNVRGSV
jgi:hypothetical protein